MRVMTMPISFLCVGLLLTLAGCGDTATLPVQAGMGPNPALPPPHHTLLPTVNIAPARGWPAGATPTASAGLAVKAFADSLDHPRWLYVLPNGDVLVDKTGALLVADDVGNAVWRVTPVSRQAAAQRR